MIRRERNEIRSLGLAASSRSLRPWLLILALGSVYSAADAQAQGITRDCSRVLPAPITRFQEQSGSSPRGPNCSGLRCYRPIDSSWFLRMADPSCDPLTTTCSLQLRVPVEFPGNAQDSSFRPLLYWFDEATPPEANCTASPSPCDYKALCGLQFGGGQIIPDFIETFIEVPGFSCAHLDAHSTLYSVKAYGPCWGDSLCRKHIDIANLEFSPGKVAAALGCPLPKKSGCPDDNSCTACKTHPGGGGASTAGEGGGATPAGGGGLSYTGGGASGSGALAGPESLGTALGRYWSHRWAERIILAPDETNVLLVTRFATFREFSDLSAGLYQTASPSDEYRSLTRTGTGWELRDLDGTVIEFGSDGRWEETRDRNGNVWTGTYSGAVLQSVSHPDGRREDFTYHPSGMLATITEVGIDGTTSRTWSHTWTGEDLERIDRPDGTAWRFVYGDANHPGFLTRMILVGNDGPPASERIASAWEYDAEGNVITFWRGADDSTSAQAVDQWSFSFDDPLLPAETTVTDPLGTASTYSIDRDTVSNKPKITQITGDCPSCGLGPNTVMEYNDLAHPMKMSRQIDGEGNVTEYTYTAEGRIASRTEAVGTTLERTTTWNYDATYPAFPTRIEQPSTAGGMNLRVTVNTYNASGDLLQRTLEGVEDGSAFTYSTIFTPDASGSGAIATVDPPGYGTADQTTFVHDPARGHLLPSSRADPLIGATTFGYDAWNRRTSTTDPNGVASTTQYDDLDRVRFRTEVGDPGAMPPVADLVTESRYNAFGDLELTVLPRGNAIAYEYDQAGRLLAIERKPDDQPTSHGERTVYQLDAAGNRTREEQQRWDGATWVTDSFTDYVYSTRCRLDQIQHADGSVTEYAYDCNGNLERIWDANHPSAGQVNEATQTYAYDALDRLTSVTQPWAGAGGGDAVTAYGYDIQDHLTSVTDAEGNLTTYAYSDRDLLTQEISPVSGTTSHEYNEHGELTQTTDARGIVTTRLVDALDRVKAVQYPTASLDITYIYDDPSVPFSLGRLTALTRHGESVDYRYDRFGRLIQDDQLTYAYDANGNKSQIGYPDGVIALYAHDFADREQSLTVQRPGLPDQTVASGATYAAGGPLTGLTLGNGLVESRTFNQRYHPTGIELAGTTTLLDWDYTTDAVGNILAIDDPATAGIDRDYGYQDIHYFLTQGDGPWGTQSWTYDRIGNRLSETRDGTTDTYAYLTNGAGGNDPRLSQITLGGGGGLKTFQYDPAGNQTQVDAAGNLIDFTYADDGRLTRVERAAAQASSDFTYDGRSFLSGSTSSYFSVFREGRSSSGGLFADGFESGDVCAWSASVGDPTNSCPKLINGTVDALYDSTGLLHGRESSSQGNSLVLHFAGRPLSLLEDPGPEESWLLLTSDHLGSPAFATDLTGGEDWQGGFEPFGRDSTGAQASGVFLRFPGQWDDEIWQTPSLGSEGQYNVHRWYQPYSGRYSRPDPMGIDGSGPNVYLYGGANPLSNTDPDGRFIPRGCKPDDVQWCQGQCQQRGLQFKGCKCFRVPLCFGLLDYAVAACKKARTDCPPCPPPPPPKIDRVPPSRPHFPCKGDHWTFFRYDQGPPPQCICRLSRIFGGCLD